MENEERIMNDGLFWNIGPIATAPNGLTYGITYPGLMPFWGFGLEPNLWGNINSQENFENSVLRHHGGGISQNIMPLEVLYPKCYKMMQDVIYIECNNFLKRNNGIMPNKIAKEEFCKMVESCTMHIMKNNDMFVSKLKENWMCIREAEDNEEENKDEEKGARSEMNMYHKLLIGSMMGILILQELKKRGCMYCY